VTLSKEEGELLTPIARETLDLVQSTTQEASSTEIRKEYSEAVRAKLKEAMPELDLVGVGAEYIVVQGKNSAEWIKAYKFNEMWQPPCEAGVVHNTNELMHTLFPYNIPEYRVVAAFPAIANERQKITGVGDDTVVSKPFDRVINLCKKYRIPVNLNDADKSNRHNFVVDAAGNEFYVDSVPLDADNVWDIDLRNITDLTSDPEYKAYLGNGAEEYIAANKKALAIYIERLQELLETRQILEKLNNDGADIETVKTEKDRFEWVVDNYPIKKERVVKMLEFYESMTENSNLYPSHLHSAIHDFIN
jgi:hypothetical protein